MNFISNVLLDITEQCDTSQNPVIRALYRLQVQISDVREVGTSRLFVDGALVEFWILGACIVDCIHVYDRQNGEENFWGLLCQLTATSIPSCSV